MQSQLITQTTTGQLGITETAKQHYARLLAMGDSCSPDDRHHLRLAAHALGKAPEQMEADLLIVRQGQNLQARLTRRQDVEVEQTNAGINLRQVESANAKIAAEREAILQSAKNREMAAETAAVELRDAERELAGLRDRYQDLLPKSK